MLRQFLYSLCAVTVFATPASAQRSIEIPGIGTITFGERDRERRVDKRDIDRRYKVLARERNRNDERRVVFDVGGRDTYTELRIRAIGKVLRITGMEVVFGNGRSQKVDIYQAIYPGEISPEIDLSGDARGIRRVILTKRRTWQRERGEIELLGLEAPRQNFEAIGTARTGRRSEDIVFENRRPHRYEAIRLKALDRAIRIDDVTIEFGNGTRQYIDFDDVLLRPGEMTKIVALDGRRARNVRQVRVDVSRRRGRRGRLQVLAARSDEPVRRRRSESRVPKGWVQFGSERFGSRTQSEKIAIGRDAGVFDRIAFRALEDDIYIHDVVVVYGNGSRERKQVGLLVPPGYGTRPIELTKGRRDRGRFIRELIITAETDSRRRRARGLLQVFGDYDDNWLRRGRGARDDRWIRLGANRAGMFSKDDDAFLVGRRYGRFTAVRVRVQRKDVKLYGMRITYENGTSEDVPVYGTLRAGQTTQAFDLKGRRRYINRVDVRYRTKFNLGGDGVVEVWGQR